MHLACNFGLMKAVYALVECNASSRVTNKSGVRPRELLTGMPPMAARVALWRGCCDHRNCECWGQGGGA